MRVDVAGAVKKTILSTDGPGFHAKRKGERKRIYVRGNTYSAEMTFIYTISRDPDIAN
ncbi:MAG: S6e family ribosomal protein [Candidatus Thorarchaeota archaeon]